MFPPQARGPMLYHIFCRLLQWSSLFYCLTLSHSTHCFLVPFPLLVCSLHSQERIRTFHLGHIPNCDFSVGCVLHVIPNGLNLRWAVEKTSGGTSIMIFLEWFAEFKDCCERAFHCWRVSLAVLALAGEDIWLQFWMIS